MMAFTKMFNIRPNTAASFTLTIIFILNYFFGYCTPQLYEGSECELKDGTLAVCKSFALCQWAIQGLNKREISYGDLNRCSFEGTNEIICCGDERPTADQRPDKNNFPTDIGGDEIYFDNNDLSFSRPKTTESSSVTPVPGTTATRPPTRIGQQRRSEIACENYTLLSTPILSEHILGGVPTVLGEFPHMAALGFPSQEIGRFEYEFNCGGSLISESYVLTAAHCVTDRNLPTIVKTGKITLVTNDDGVDGITSTIAEIIVHPSYTRSRSYDDIALIRLSSPITFDDYVRPACLQSNVSDIDPSISLIVTGWGKTTVDKEERSNGLLKTNLTGVALDSCNSSLLAYNANDRKLRNGVNLGQLCANDPDAKHDSCAGDSGGPLQIYQANGMSTVVGVTSFGVSCGSALPSVYARVAFYLDWIESHVWPNR